MKSNEILNSIENLLDRENFKETLTKLIEIEKNIVNIENNFSRILETKVNSRCVDDDDTSLSKDYYYFSASARKDCKLFYMYFELKFNDDAVFTNFNCYLKFKHIRKEGATSKALTLWQIEQYKIFLDFLESKELIFSRNSYCEYFLKSSDIDSLKRIIAAFNSFEY